jgi:hypothetical protein
MASILNEERIDGIKPTWKSMVMGTNIILVAAIDAGKHGSSGISLRGRGTLLSTHS